MKWLTIGLTFLLPAHGLPSVPVLKCCPNGSVLDVSNGYRCVSQVAVDVFVVINGLNVTEAKDKNNIQQIKLDKKGVGRPACEHREHHVIQTEGTSENWITTTGDLVTRKYEAEFDHGEFCLDRSRHGDRTSIVALMCDPCKTKACISLCCPHGYAKQPDPSAPEGSPLVCLPHPESNGWNPEFWDSSTQQLVAMERHTDYVIVGAVGREGFSCPKFDGKPVEVSSADLHYEVTQLDDSGRLVGTLYNETSVFKQNQFCLAYAKFPDYDYDYEDGSGQYLHENSTESGGDVIVNIELTTVDPEYEVSGGSSLATLYLVCENPDAATATENFITAFYPSALLISAFFILVTMIVYILLKELHGNLFGKITIGFLLNLFITYIVFAYTFIKDDLRADIERESIGCYLLAYIRMYTFLAFFFWLSAMAFNIARKFSNIMRMSDVKRDKISLIIIIIYSQGSPLILCIFTYLMDYTRPEGLVLPNMAVYNCFLGSEPNSSGESYLSSPQFMYFHLIIIIIQLFNLSCFLVTASYLVCHWRTAKNLKKNNDEDHLANFFILLKLFILMGIPWIAELISGAIEYTTNNPKAHIGIIFIDLINLFIGVLIFFVLVFKKTVWKSLKKRALGRDSSSGSASRKNTTMSSTSVESTAYQAGAAAQWI